MDLSRSLGSPQADNHRQDVNATTQLLHELNEQKLLALVKR
jgi:hypothetical protein